MGGAPTNVGQIKAYLRITEKDSGPLDFDSPGGMETTWQRIYLLLRCGFQQEAVEVRQSCVIVRLTITATVPRLIV
jgi:nuclear pore complex protein Nup93